MKQEPSTLGSLEALLFIHGEPLDIKKIEKFLEIRENECKELLLTLEKSLASGERGLALVVQGGKVQLVSKPDYHSILERFVKEQFEEDLSPASAETLAIISYFGPISRARIDYQRGVNSSMMIRSLLIRGLVERFPDPRRSNAYLYEPSFDLLRHLGIARKEELPEYERFASILKKAERELESVSVSDEKNHTSPAP